MNKIDTDIVVSIQCLTYNHVKYIRQCLDGFIMQKTNFRFEAIVHDDASTDGTSDVIREYADKYPQIIKPILETENLYSKGGGLLQKRMNDNTHGKYIAICEGDDYWIDPLKLQRQVDFLENHPDYSMCFHRAKFVYEGGFKKIILKCDDIENRDYSPNELLEQWKVPTASIVAKREELEVRNFGEDRVLNGDIIHVLNSAKIGKIRGMSIVMSVYRVQCGGVTYDYEFKKNRILRYPDHFKFIKENYPFVDKKLINRSIARAYMDRRKMQSSRLAYIMDMLTAFVYRPTIIMDKINYLLGKEM